MKLTPLVATGIFVVILLMAGVVYMGIQLSWASRQINALNATRAAAEGRMAAMQASIDGFKKDIKQYDEAIGAQGTIQILAKQLENGEKDLTLRSLKIVSKGKAVVSLGSVPDAGGLVQVAASDGTSIAEIAAMPGKSKIGIKATTGTDPATVVHVATFGDEGYYFQKGPTDDPTTRTDGAGLQILDDGPEFLMAQAGGGNVSFTTSSADERAKLSIWADGNPKKLIYLSLGAKDIPPFVSVAGVASGASLTLLPERLTLANHDGNIELAAAEDTDGGFVYVNDKSGERRATMTAGTDGHGSITVIGKDNRSNTFYPEYNIQRTGTVQK